MRITIFIFLFFICRSVGAQSIDTSYFNSSWEEVKKSQRYLYYSVYERGESKSTRSTYFKHGMKYSYGECSDKTFETRHGIFCWYDNREDTMALEYYEKGVLKTEIIYEGKKPSIKIVHENDTTFYTYGVSGRKYITSKRLYIGEMEYHFFGKDSFADMNRLRFAFRRKGVGADYHIVKFKMLPWTIGNDGGMTYSLGYEFNFHRVHSFEIVGTYFDWSSSHEDGYGNPSPAIYNVRRSLQFDYRYYFNPVKKIKDEWKFFVSPFVRYMKWKDYYSEGALTNYFKNESWNYTTGIVLGFGVDMTNYDGLYTEFFIGPQYIHRLTEEGLTENSVTVENSYFTDKFGIRFGMNFCGLLARKK